MKLNTVLALALLGVMAACSPNDDNTSSGNPTEYYPLQTGNYWTYDVTGTGTTVVNRDSLYVANDTMISGKSYQKFKTKDLPFGFYSGSLNGNSVRKDGDRLLLTGGAGAELSAQLPIDLQLKDFVVFDESAASKKKLDEVSGVTTQTFQEYPLTINYTLKSVSNGKVSSFTAPNGTVYSDVIAVATTLNLAITTKVEIIAGQFTTVPVMEKQDVVVSTSYFVKNIGVVFTNTDVNYHFSFDIPNAQIPSSNSQNQKEILKMYNVNP